MADTATVVTMRGNSRRISRSVLALAVVGALALAACHPAPTTPIEFNPVPIASWRTDGVGRATLLVGDVLYVGGDFGTVSSPNGSTSMDKANLAAFDINTGALISGFTAHTNGTVQTLAHDGTRLYVGGEFTSVNGQSRARLAALDPATGAVDQGWYTQSYGNVYALAIGGGQLFVGGSFSTIANTARSRVASFDLGTGSITSFNPSPDGTVGAITASAIVATIGDGKQSKNGRKFAAWPGPEPTPLKRSSGGKDHLGDPHQRHVLPPSSSIEGANQTRIARRMS